MNILQDGHRKAVRRAEILKYEQGKADHRAKIYKMTKERLAAGLKFHKTNRKGWPQGDNFKNGYGKAKILKDRHGKAARRTEIYKMKKEWLPAGRTFYNMGMKRLPSGGQF